MPPSPATNHDHSLPPRIPTTPARDTFPLEPVRPSSPTIYSKSSPTARHAPSAVITSSAHDPSPTALLEDPGSTELEELFPADSRRPHGGSSSAGHDDDEYASHALGETEVIRLIADDRRGPMSKAPLLIRSSPGLGTGSYGAAPIDPAADDTAVADDGILTESLQRRSAEAGLDSSRRRKSQSTTRSNGLARESISSLSRRRRISEEIGGSTVVGGVEGRFGVTETSLPSEPIIDAKSSASSLHSDDDANVEHDFDGDFAADINDEDPPDNSPYPQVRASVAPTDNTTLSINTPRMWTLSTLFAILGSSTNLFFSLRYPSVAITPVIALLLVHPLGLLWDFALRRRTDPPEEFVDGERTGASIAIQPGGAASNISEKRSRRERFRLWLAQGRWNEKEHSCVYVSSNVSFGFAFATDVIVEQTQFYKQDASIVYQLLLTLSTQILGYAFAGLTRRFLVRPSGMIWPGTLMSAAMFTTLHKEENNVANGWTMSRWKFFYIIWTGAFLFYFFPGLLMPALSYFNVITWFAPDNVVVSNLFGVVSGLGLFPVTFDWAQIAYIGSPLLTPFWAAMNVVGGLVIVMWVIAPIAYYTNTFYSSYMPILSSSVFDNTGKIYNVSRILTPEFLFDSEGYASYSRVFLPITYVLSYGLQFAGLASLLTHTACWHGKDIWTQWKRSLKEAEDESKPDYQPLSNGDTGLSPISRNGASQPLRRSTSSNFDSLMSREDVHNRLMKRYKDAPLSWYLLTAITMTAIGVFVVE